MAGTARASRAKQGSSTRGAFCARWAPCARRLWARVYVWGLVRGDTMTILLILFVVVGLGCAYVNTRTGDDL